MTFTLRSAVKQQFVRSFYLRAENDVTSYFRSEAIAEKREKCRLRRLGGEFIGNGLTEEHEFWEATGHSTNSCSVWVDSAHYPPWEGEMSTSFGLAG